MTFTNLNDDKRSMQTTQISRTHDFIILVVIVLIIMLISGK